MSVSTTRENSVLLNCSRYLQAFILSSAYKDYIREFNEHNERTTVYQLHSTRCRIELSLGQSMYRFFRDIKQSSVWQ